MTVHWISHEWELKEILIDFSCTTNNTLNNDTFMKVLEKTCKDQNIEFTVYNNYIRYLAYIGKFKKCKTMHCSMSNLI
ncbi:hypothetical protein RhiirA1_482346 [Rhizophagus irregularis]|uniref:Uncharacterized protein n=1 Tax=Rhizophagus irregularis TaxID=588596 RepID=A0A2I1F6U0_9GLOM|nr:hypothetical protein RhiirA1_482346 [Rhizophagus irregularis]PKY30095.1 hypothetical protein RhiirB3_447017 [Rhizophagus irregularis]